MVLHKEEDESPSVLLVDDDDVFRERLARALRERRFYVRTAGSYDEALAKAKEESPELAVLDLRMPEHSGLELLRELLSLDPQTRAIVLTGYGSIATAVDAMRLGAVHYLPKPADADDIVLAFARGEEAILPPVPSDYHSPSLARAEWEHINRVLSDCGGNISAAARCLRVHRRSLQRKLNKRPPGI